MNSSFPNRWSFSYLKFTKYVTNIIAKPKYKYGQQEQVTASRFESYLVANTEEGVSRDEAHILFDMIHQMDP